MEHTNGVWIPIGIFALILLGWVIKLMRASNVTTAHRDNTQPRPEDVVSAHPVKTSGSKAISDEQESRAAVKGDVTTSPGAPYPVAVRPLVAHKAYIKLCAGGKTSDAFNPVNDPRSNQYSC